MKLENRDIVCLASASWDSMWVNAQHLMHRLAADNRVLYLNNLGLRAPGISRGDWQKIRKRVGEWFSGLRRVEENLWVFSPVNAPLHGLAPARAFNRWNLRRAVRAAARELGFRRPIFWTFLPLGLDLLGQLDESLTVYHCVDDYAANPGVDADALRALEDEMLARAELTIVTNPVLFDERRDKAKDILCFENVADVAHFAPRPDRALPPDMAALPRPILGYAGNISGYKTDLDLLAHAAKALPQASFALVGPVGWGDPNTDVGALERLPNVHFLGRAAFERLPDYVAAFDVGLLPMRINDSTTRSFPMKFYEYMAAGKPIVAVELPAFAAYRDRPELCRLTADADGFVAAIRAALDETADHAPARLAEARRHSWDVRAAQIGEAVAERLATKENDV
jgi:glycosyltransferase involved in cell wall biosynthesis